MIPKKIKRELILIVIQDINKNGVSKQRESKKFKLEFNGKYYPPKYDISLANKFVNEFELSPSLFNGGRCHRIKHPSPNPNYLFRI